jgi:hypothetical protein
VIELYEANREPASHIAPNHALLLGVHRGGGSRPARDSFPHLCPCTPQPAGDAKRLHELIRKYGELRIDEAVRGGYIASFGDISGDAQEAIGGLIYLLHQYAPQQFSI